MPVIQATISKMVKLQQPNALWYGWIVAHVAHQKNHKHDIQLAATTRVSRRADDAPLLPTL